MAVSHHPYRWSLDEFVLAWEAGAFDKRAELIDGEVWDVPIGAWHAETTGAVIRALPNGRVKVMAGSLPSAQSLPEPDCWVRRADATPAQQLSRRMSRWAPEDVPLVVEVSDETLDHDLTRKSDLYAEAGFAHYWSVTRRGVYAHSDPTANGYATRTLHSPGQQIPVPYADGVTLEVSMLIGPDAS